ncbi:MAG: hypothetical protein JO196_20080 [Hyphomicrobiales bacterium]|nr:hypothetical protein [Hyphomicrobiales bacterium]
MAKVMVLLMRKLDGPALGKIGLDEEPAGPEIVFVHVQFDPSPFAERVWSCRRGVLMASRASMRRIPRYATAMARPEVDLA